MKRLLVQTPGLLLLISLSLAGCGGLEFGVETKLSTGQPDVTPVAVVPTQQIPDNVVPATSQAGRPYR